MLSLLIGAPGGGKSYEAVVYHVLPAVRKGRLVITNLPLNVDAFSSIDPSYPDCIKIIGATADNPIPFSRREDYESEWRGRGGVGPLFVIDEAHIPLPNKETKKDVEIWFSLHRHMLADVVLITQNYQKISKAIIGITQTMYRVRKNLVFGSDKTYTRKVYDGVRGHLIETTIRKYRKEFFRLYKSHTLTEDTDVKEDTKGAYKSFWHHWIFKVMVVFSIFAVYTLSHVDFGAISRFGKPKPPASVSLTPVVLGSTVPTTPRPPIDIASIPIHEADGDADAVIPDRVVGDYPFKGSRFRIVATIRMDDKVNFIFEVLPKNDYSKYIQQVQAASLAAGTSQTGRTASGVASAFIPAGQQAIASVPAPPAPRRVYVRSQTLSLIGYQIQWSDDACDLLITFSRDKATDTYYASCSMNPLYASD